ncbi:sugar nucleotide-binding protein [Gammaproteobacteria bacterium]|nr:sugar nucleotide-binding protein [Gammaproteobacteria bacterium]
MKIALTGSSGILGSSFQKYCDLSGIECYALKRDDYIEEISNSFVGKTLLDKNISIFVHCAANTNVDECEEFPDACFRDNYYLTERLGKICKVLNIKFVFISSTGIYGDLSELPHNELDQLSPTTNHHQSKVLAERALQQSMSNYLIIRTGWLFGGDWNAPKNFVANRIREAQASPQSMKSNISQRGCPTYVEDVVSCIFLLLAQDQTGIFNCVNKGNASRYEYVEAILRLAGLEVNLIAVDGSEFNRLASVPKNEMACNVRLGQIGLNCMPKWRNSLASYLKKNKALI